jgi:hypothetical protein
LFCDPTGQDADENRADNRDFMHDAAAPVLRWSNAILT